MKPFKVLDCDLTNKTPLSQERKVSDETYESTSSSLTKDCQSELSPTSPTNAPSSFADLDKLSELRFANRDRIIIAHLNINSIRNKLEMLKIAVANHLDILLISETKLDQSFPKAQFHINGFSLPYRLDRTVNGGGLLLFVREGLSSNLVTNTKFEDNSEIIFVNSI